MCIALASAVTARARADTAVMARGDQLVSLPPARDRAPHAGTLERPLPLRPFVLDGRRVLLPGSAATAPLALPDGQIVVGIASPGQLVWLDRRGGVRVRASLEDRPALDLAATGDGRVFVATENRSVYAVAPDGSVRGAFGPFASLPLGGPVARPDGSVVLVTNSGTASGEITLVSPVGDLVATRPLPGRAVSPPVLGHDGCLWLALTARTVCVRGQGRPTELGFARGAGALLPLGTDILAFTTGTELQLRSTRGAARGRVELGLVTPTLWPLPTGLAVVHAGTPPEILLLGRDAAVLARLPVPGGGLVGVLQDPAGATLTVGGSGELAVFEPGGAPRWSLQLPGAIRHSPAPLPGGGLAVATADGALFLLR